MWVSIWPECNRAPNLASLPPTNGNVVHAHLRVAFWQNVLQPDPSGMDPFPTNGPNQIRREWTYSRLMDPTAFRWSLEDGSKIICIVHSSSLFPTATYIIIKHNTIQYSTICKTQHEHYIYKSNLCWKRGEQKCNTYLWFTPTRRYY